MYTDLCDMVEEIKNMSDNIKRITTSTIPIPDEDKIKEIKSAPEKLIIGNNNNNLNRNEYNGLGIEFNLLETTLTP